MESMMAPNVYLYITEIILLWIIFEMIWAKSGRIFSTKWEVYSDLTSLELRAPIGVSLRLIYIVITSLCGFDIDSPTPMARIEQLSQRG